LVDFGPQALSNRFLARPDEDEAFFSFVLSQCHDCGMIQIGRPIAPKDLKPRFDWLRYNEQESHLDDVVAKARTLAPTKKDYTVGAISFKDDTTVSRFQKAGFENTWRLDLEKDLGVSDPLAGLETIQAVLTPDMASKISHDRSFADLLIARHVLEHGHDTNQFLEAISLLVKPAGHIILEVPDCEPALQRRDYTMFWEEHILYFTPESFQSTLLNFGFSPVLSERYIYSNENSLVAIVRRDETEKPIKKPIVASPLLEKGRAYSEAFPDIRKKIAEALESQRGKNRKIAVFGAGHLSCAWINFLGLKDNIDFVVDDHPKKRGLFMPGSHLPILGSAELIRQNVSLCLLTLSPESETKVVENNKAFLENGGRFASIFPGKNNSFAT